MSSHYEQANAWLANHPVVWLAVTVALPGLAYTASGMWVNNQSFVDAAPLGVVFGVVFATVLFLGRWLVYD